MALSVTKAYLRNVKATYYGVCGSDETMVDYQNFKNIYSFLCLPVVMILYEIIEGIQMYIIHQKVSVNMKFSASLMKNVIPPHFFFLIYVT